MADTKEKSTIEKTAKKSQKVEAEQDASEIAEAKVEEAKEEKAIAKAGKRSAKAVAETEGKAEKEERKAKKADAAPEKPRRTVKPPRSKLERAGKKYREAAKLIEAGKVYSLGNAVEIIVKTSPTKFDSTIEMHLNLNVDPKQADQNIRGTVVLPAGSGKSLKVAVFADEPDAAKAGKAGANITGVSEILAQLDKEQINFDILIATPTEMAKLGKYARLLGPKGLMPNPKSGTVTNDVVNAVSEAKAGRVEYRVDAQSIIHLPVGKVSFGPAKLDQNTRAVLDSVRSSKPATVKGNLIKSIYLSTTMGPSIKVEV